MTAPDDMTLVTPLRAKDGMTLPDFYDITTKYQGVITPAGERAWPSPT